jgi:cellulose synthase/poly-beta-1,6-N-acetylglucosamine synthase-like glycosyltransferase
LKQNEKVWKGLFVTVVILWLLTISSIVYLVVSGSEPLINKSVDLYFLTLPLLVLALLYVCLSIFMFALYMLTFQKVKKKQMLAVRRSALKKALAINSVKNALSLEIGNNSRCERIGSLLIYNESWNQKTVCGGDPIEDTDLCSIVIAARNEESVIKRSVIECLNQTYRNIEVIVVCHNCTDGTYKEAHVGDQRVHAFDFKTTAAGKGIALNFGVEKANGKYLLILDADGILSHDFIEKALPLFDDGYAAVQGRYIPSNRDYSLITKMLAIEGDLWSTPYLTARASLDKRCGLGGTGYIIRKDILVDVGRFTNHLVDDYELTGRLLRKKYRIGFAPLCVNYDEKPPNLEITFKQRSRWAKGFLDLLKHRVVEPTDMLGFLFWMNPIAAFAGFVFLLLSGFAAIHNMIFQYYPYYYASIPIDIWVMLVGSFYAMQALTLVRQYGKSGLKYSAYLPIYNVFILYCFVALIKAFTVRSWASTKTTHGFTKKSAKITTAT